MTSDLVERPTGGPAAATVAPAPAPPCGSGPAETASRELVAWREAAQPAASTGAGRLLRDAALTLATLGLYRCWVRTRCRQELWASVRLGGVALRYAGQVRDLLVPALAILGGLLVVALGLWVLSRLAVPRPRIQPSPWRLLVTLPLVYVLGLAAWRQRAFLVERTLVGDAESRLEGSRHGYALRHLLTALAVPLTLGWIVPFRQVMLQRRLIEGMRLGSHRLAFEGDARALLGRFAFAWAGVIATYLAAVLAIAVSSVGRKVHLARIGGSWPSLDGAEIALVGCIAAVAGLALALLFAWYRIGVWRCFAAATRLDGTPLRLDVATGGYLACCLGNIGLRVGSAGLLAPHAEARHARYLLARLHAAPADGSG